MARTKPPFLSALGVAFEIFKAISDAVIEAGGNDESLRSLLNDPDKRRRVALEIVGHKPALPVGGGPYRGGSPSEGIQFNTYRLPVTYAKLPGVAVLEEKFSKGGVSYLYDGRAWTRHKSCVTIDETPSEREFYVAEIPGDFLCKRIDTIEDALAEHVDRLGYRFAIETEAVEFAHAQPELQRKNWIYALGSSALSDDGSRFVAMLGAYGRYRILDGNWVGLELRGSARVLLVRKVS